MPTWTQQYIDFKVKNMPYILMPNATKIFVQEAGYSEPEVSFLRVINDLTLPNNNVASKSIAARTLGSLGVMAVDAISNLEDIIVANNDMSVTYSCLSALEKISSKHKEACNGNTLQERIDKLKKFKETVVEPTKKKKVQIDIVQAEHGDLDNGVNVSRKCNFCEKETIAQPEIQRLTEKLCHPNKFYCSFCLRNNLNTKDNKHILMLTFRAIFGYFYYEFYQQPKTVPAMYLSEIQDYIDSHRDVGMHNPLFNYDPESYVWFIDFRRVGTSKKKISIEDVKQTVVNILASFNLASTVPGITMNKLYQKYQEAIDDFYTKRYRPEGKALLCPTLKNCGNIAWGGITTPAWQANQQYQHQTPQTQQSPKMTLEDIKGFLPHIIDPSKYWQKTAQL